MLRGVQIYSERCWMCCSASRCGRVAHRKGMRKCVSVSVYRSRNKYMQEQVTGGVCNTTNITTYTYTYQGSIIDYTRCECVSRWKDVSD